MSQTYDVGIVLGGKDEFTAVAKKAGNALDRLARGAAARTGNALDRIRRTVFSLKGALAALGLGLVAAGFLNTAASMETFEVQMSTVLGSMDAAKERMIWIRDFAATTPFEIPQLVEASNRLEAYGINATKHLRTLGDTAGAMGKDIMMAVEAMADAQTGEFERLKEFGIKAIQDSGKTFLLYTDKFGHEQKAMIDRNNRAIITSTLSSIWNEKYAGGMEKASKTWNGMWSNMKDWFTQFQEKVMNSGLFAFLKEGLQNLLGWLNQMKENGRMDIWANRMGKAMIKAFSAIAKVASNLPLVFHTVSSAIKNMFAFVLAVINEAILQTVEIVLDLGSKIPVIGKKFAGWRDAVIDLRKNVDDLAVSTLESANANDEAAIRAAEFAVQAESAIDRLKTKTLELTDARLKDVAAAGQQAGAGGGGSALPGPANIAVELGPGLGGPMDSRARVMAGQESLNTERRVQEEILAIKEEYRLLQLEAEGFQSEAKMERLRMQHAQEIEMLRQHGANQAQIEQVVGMQRAEIERATQAAKTSAYIKGAQTMQALFPKFKATAVLEGLLNAKGAIVKAWNSAPFPWNLPAVATTTRSVTSLLSSLKGTGGGGGASMNIPSPVGGGTVAPQATGTQQSGQSEKPATIIQYHIHGAVFGDLDSAARALKPSIDKAVADGVT